MHFRFGKKGRSQYCSYRIYLYISRIVEWLYLYTMYTVQILSVCHRYWFPLEKRFLARKSDLEPEQICLFTFLSQPFSWWQPSASPPDWLQSRTLIRVRKTCRGHRDLYPLVDTSNRRGCPSQTLRSSRGSMRSRWGGWRWRYSCWKMKLRGEIGLWTLPLMKNWKEPCKYYCFISLIPKTSTNTNNKLITNLLHYGLRGKNAVSSCWSSQSPNQAIQCCSYYSVVGVPA